MGLKVRGSKNSLKTRQNASSVESFLSTVKHSVRAQDARTTCQLMESVTLEKPKMWGKSIVGFGSYHYVGAGGREGDWPLVGFSPRQSALSIYCMPGFKDLKKELSALGPHKHSVGCLYLTDLSQNNLKALKNIIAKSVKIMKKRYGV